MPSVKPFYASRNTFLLTCSVLYPGVPLCVSTTHGVSITYISTFYQDKNTLRSLEFFPASTFAWKLVVLRVLSIHLSPEETIGEDEVASDIAAHQTSIDRDHLLPVVGYRSDFYRFAFQSVVRTSLLEVCPASIIVRRKK